MMDDEVTDVSNKEQVVVCFRSVDDQFEPYEDFVVLYVVESIKAAYLWKSGYNVVNELAITVVLLICASKEWYIISESEMTYHSLPTNLIRSSD